MKINPSTIEIARVLVVATGKGGVGWVMMAVGAQSYSSGCKIVPLSISSGFRLLPAISTENTRFCSLVQFIDDEVLDLTLSLSISLNVYSSSENYDF